MTARPAAGPIASRRSRAPLALAMIGIGWWCMPGRCTSSARRRRPAGCSPRCLSGRRAAGWRTGSDAMTRLLPHPLLSAILVVIWLLLVKRAERRPSAAGDATRLGGASVHGTLLAGPGAGATTTAVAALHDGGAVRHPGRQRHGGRLILGRQEHLTTGVSGAAAALAQRCWRSACSPTPYH